MEASPMPQQCQVSWICPGSRVSIDVVLPRSDLSGVSVALFLSSCIGIELTSLSLKSMEHMDWQFYQATQPYDFVDCIWHQNTRRQSSACLLKSNVAQDSSSAAFLVLSLLLRLKA